MPMNADFSLEVLVGGCVLPEYSKDGDHFVECCLFTPITYTQKVEEIVNGEKEKQVISELTGFAQALKTLGLKQQFSGP